MHQFHKGIERRLRALEQRLGTIVEPETTDQIDRRASLVRAAHVGLVPEDLTEDERVTFTRIVATVPVALEIRDGGLVDGHGGPAGGDLHRDDDGDDDGELAWVP